MRNAHSLLRRAQTRSTSTLATVVLAALPLGAVGCSGTAVPDFHGSEPPMELAPESVQGTVGDQLGSGCSTAVVLGLSHQIADEINCLHPHALTSFTAGGGIQISGGAVLTYLASDAVADLQRAARSTGDLEINSAFRTVAQQYLLYEWWQRGQCGIAIAATPGTSNHESARAVDLSNWSAVLGTMASDGWAHDVAGDDVHFDHLASPDLTGTDVLAFQRLWNRNHPGDTIAEDGQYGAGTAARLLQSPAAGFAQGACSSGTTIDDSDGAHFSDSGAWTTSTSVPGYDGAEYKVLAPGQAGWAAWALPLAAGSYELQVRYTPFKNRSSRALYRVYTSQGATPTTVTIDQRSGGTVSLGTFTVGAGASVTLDPNGADGYTIADAVIALPR